MTMVNEGITALLDTVLSKPIAFHRIFAAIAGGVTEGVFLSQAYYWSFRTTMEGEWFYKTMEDWEDETALTRSEQEKARKKLIALKILEVKKEGLPCKLYYRIDRKRLYNLIAGADLQGLSVEKVISLYGLTLVHLSKAGVMRATREGVEKEYVDYRNILRVHGLTCHICNTPITRGIGQDREHLHFDHVIPISKKGSHTYENIRPAHASCNLSKGAETLDTLSLSSVSKLEELPKANYSDFGKQTRSSSEDKLSIIQRIQAETTSRDYEREYPERADAQLKSTHTQSQFGFVVPEPLASPTDLSKPKEQANTSFTPPTTSQAPQTSQQTISQQPTEQTTPELPSKATKPQEQANVPSAPQEDLHGFARPKCEPNKDIPPLVDKQEDYSQDNKTQTQTIVPAGENHSHSQKTADRVRLQWERTGYLPKIPMELQAWADEDLGIEVMQKYRISGKIITTKRGDIRPEFALYVCQQNKGKDIDYGYTYIRKLESDPTCWETLAGLVLKWRIAEESGNSKINVANTVKPKWVYDPNLFDTEEK